MISDHSRFVLKKQWDCVVTSLESDGTINATARDPEKPEEDALELEFSLDEVVEKDMGLVRTGAKFYWTLGKRHYPDGHVESVNFLSWRRSAETLQGAKFDWWLINTSA